MTEEKMDNIYCKYRGSCPLRKSDLCIVKNIEPENLDFNNNNTTNPECMLYEALKYVDMKFKSRDKKSLEFWNNLNK